MSTGATSSSPPPSSWRSPTASGFSSLWVNKQWGRCVRASGGRASLCLAAICLALPLPCLLCALTPLSYHTPAGISDFFFACGDSLVESFVVFFSHDARLHHVPRPLPRRRRVPLVSSAAPALCPLPPSLLRCELQAKPHTPLLTLRPSVSLKTTPHDTAEGPAAGGAADVRVPRHHGASSNIASSSSASGTWAQRPSPRVRAGGRSVCLSGWLCVCASGCVVGWLVGQLSG